MFKLQILVPIHTFPDGNAENIARHVANIAQLLNADVHALVLNAVFPHLSNAVLDALIDMPAIIRGAKEKSSESGSAVMQVMETELRQLGIPLRTTKIECFPGGAAADVVTRLARYHDLVLVGIGADTDTPQNTAEAAIFGSGRPTLLVPEDAPVTAFGHVLIAWDGSRVAARAVSDARDFLQKAKTVTVVTVSDEKVLPDEDIGSHLAEYLSHHDIKAAVVQVLSHGRSIAPTLQEQAQEIGADLLVMGGFGHSRTRDFVLGSATGGILKDLRLRVLMSH